MHSNRIEPQIFEQKGKRIHIELENLNNEEYYFVMEVGTQKQQVSFSFNMNTPYMVIPTTNCTECAIHEKYDNSASSAFMIDTQKLVEMYTWRARVRGFESEDNLLLNLATQLKKVPFIAAFELILNKSIIKAAQFGLGRAGSEAPYIFTELKKKGIINKASVSFAIHVMQQQSHFIIGEPDQRFVNSNSSFNVNLKLRQKQQNNYVFQLKNAHYGIQDLYSQITDANIDISQPWLGMPPLEFDRVKRFLERNYGLYKADDGTYKIACQRIPLMNFKFELKNELFEIRYDNLWKAGQRGQCTLLVFQASNWVLGQTFLRNKYVILDYENQTLQLVQSRIVNETPYTEPVSSGTAVFTIVVTVVIAIIIGMIVALCCKRRKMISRMKISEESEDGSFDGHLKPSHYLSVSALYEENTEYEIET